MSDETAFLILALTVLIAFAAGWWAGPHLDRMIDPPPIFINCANPHFC